MSTFLIPTINFDRFQVKITRLASKAEKLGFPTVAWQELGRKNKECEPGQWVKVVEVQVQGIAPIISGWRFVAKLEQGQEHGENFVFSFSEIPLPEKYRTALMDCDHCGQNRQRKAVYVVQNVEDESEFKQVGSTCLKDFTGHPAPGDIASAAEAILKLKDIQEEFEFDGGGVRSPDMLKLDLYLAWCAEDIERHGWASRSAAYGTMPTADAALVKMGDVKYRDDLKQHHKDRAAEALVWAREVLAQKADLNEYEWNLVQVTKEGESDSPALVLFSKVGLAASLLPAHHRAMDLVRKAEENPSRFQGEIGKRQEWELELVEIIGLGEGRWGPSYLHKFVDSAGNEFVWITGKRLGFGLCKGLATVKAHEIFKGVEQTVLIRCKFDVTCKECGKQVLPDWERPYDGSECDCPTLDQLEQDGFKQELKERYGEES